jgi:hypothetical protein
MNKTETRAWLKRAREDIRDIEASLKAGNTEAVSDYAGDLSCVGAEIQTAFQTEE